MNSRNGIKIEKYTELAQVMELRFYCFSSYHTDVSMEQMMRLNMSVYPRIFVLGEGSDQQIHGIEKHVV